MQEGNDGRWQFEGEVDVFHFYLSNTALSLMAEANDHGAFVELHEGLDVDDPVLGCLAREAAQACAEGRQGQLYATTLGLAMGLRLLRGHSNLSPTARLVSTTGKLAPWQSRRVTEFLKTHYSEDISLSQLAAMTQLSPFHFARAFKQSTGLPPHRYQIRLRIERAKDLLTNTSMPMSDVAAAVGYDDQSHFAQLFRREVGVTPSAYRRERQP